jgi:hypothetical protein
MLLLWSFCSSDPRRDHQDALHMLEKATGPASAAARSTHLNLERVLARYPGTPGALPLLTIRIAHMATSVELSGRGLSIDVPVGSC